MDASETTLITSNQTYEEYRRLQSQREEMQKAQEEQKASMTSSDKDVQEVLDRGNHYLEELRKSNDAIRENRSHRRFPIWRWWYRRFSRGRRSTRR